MTNQSFGFPNLFSGRLSHITVPNTIEHFHAANIFQRVIRCTFRKFIRRRGRRSWCNFHIWRNSVSWASCRQSIRLSDWRTKPPRTLTIKPFSSWICRLVKSSLDKVVKTCVLFHLLRGHQMGNVMIAVLVFPQNFIDRDQIPCEQRLLVTDFGKLDIISSWSTESWLDYKLALRCTFWKRIWSTCTTNLVQIQTAENKNV